MALIKRRPESVREMARWDPMREFEELSQEMTGWFNRMLGTVPRRGEGAAMPASFADWYPAVDVTETDQEYVVAAELPGVKKDDVKVSTEEGRLVLRGERKEQHEEKGRRMHRIERAYGSFYRSFELPDDVDASKIAAEFKDGVLNVHLPKTQAKPKEGREISIT